MGNSHIQANHLDVIDRTCECRGNPLVLYVEGDHFECSSC